MSIETAISYFLSAVYNVYIYRTDATIHLINTFIGLFASRKLINGHFCVLGKPLPKTQNLNTQNEVAQTILGCRYRICTM